MSYIKPEIKEIKIKVEQQILSGSNENSKMDISLSDAPQYNEEEDGITILSKRNSIGIWDGD